LALREKLTEPEGPDVAQSLMTLGIVFMRTDRISEAEPLLRRAHTIFTKTLRSDHWRVAAAAGAYGECLHRLGRDSEAEPLLVAALPGVIRALGKHHSRAIHLERLLLKVRQSPGDRDYSASAVRASRQAALQ
jgi:hypothetical protein